jgi:hypothetical protein
MNRWTITGRYHAASFVRALLLLISMGGIAACSGAPTAPETTIYKAGLNSIHLERDPESVSNAHPVTLDPTQIGTLLRGVRVWERRNLIHRLYSGEAERTRAFRNEEITILGPALSKALALASPDQRVYFHLSHVTDYGEEETTSGWLSVRGNLLYLALSEVHDRHGPGPDISKYDRQMPNVPERSPAFDATFEPEEYLFKVRSGWRLFAPDQREELQIRYRDALAALTKTPQP